MWSQFFRDLIFCERCRQCRTYIASGAGTGETLCAGCHDQLLTLSPHIDWLKLSHERELAVASALPYTGAVRTLIKGLKYEEDELAVFDLAPAMACAWQRFDLAAVSAPGQTMLVPIPLYFWRQFRRGYNQAELLARALAPRLGIRVCPQALRRTKFTRAQFSLGRAQRQANLQDAFAGNQKLLGGQTVVLIDDVVTTGATLKEAARTAYAGGASLVVALTAAYALPAQPEKASSNASSVCSMSALECTAETKAASNCEGGQ